MSDTDQWVQDIIALHQAAHAQLRTEIAALDAAALNWTPGADTSAIGTIVVHALGAEAEMLRNLLQLPTRRDRDAEFAPQTHEGTALLQRIAGAEAEWAHLAPDLAAADLRTPHSRPNKPTPQSGYYWLLRNYGHLREHLAQVQFTKQLYQARG